MRTSILTLCAVLAAGMAAGQNETAPVAPGSVAFLGITLYDTSTEGALNGARPDEGARVDLITRIVADRMAQEGFALVDTAPVADELARTRNVTDCNGCDLRMAETLDADYALVGQVQKVSNLILSIKLVMRETASGRMVRGQSVDIRSNTDESWQRGVRYILENGFFALRGDP